MGSLTLFLPLAFLMLVFAVGLVCAKNAVTSALCLVGNLFLMAGLFAMLDADFVAAIQVIVYAGAIVVLFVFVIMLLNLRQEGFQRFKLPIFEWIILVLTIVGFGGMAYGVLSSEPSGVIVPLQVAAAQDTAIGNTELVGLRLFTKYLWPFELASMLILLAIVASVVIAKKPVQEGANDGSL